MGYILAIVHLLFTSDIWKEPIKKTELYDSTMNKYISLSGAYLIGNSMNYFDRIFLMATMGATGVGHYYISGVFGKVLNLLTAPINMVMLSYLSKKKHVSAREIVMSIAILLGIVLMFILAANQFAMSIINILYSESANEVKPLVLICTVATVLTACTSIYKTLSMRYNTGKYVFLVEVIYIILYIGLALTFTEYWGIKGFCFSIIVASIIRMFFFIYALLKKSHV